jgi:hypothetical protein
VAAFLAYLHHAWEGRRIRARAGHTKFNRKIDRFQRRGRAACRSEWRLITATHNLLKLHQQHLWLAAT